MKLSLKWPSSVSDILRMTEHGKFIRLTDLGGKNLK